MTGLTLGIIGLALTVLLCGIGSGLGLKATASASAGVLAEDPKKFGKVFILTLLPATQGLYGFLIALIGARALPTIANMSAAMIPGAIEGTEISVLSVATDAQIMAQGWYVVFACLPMMIGGMVSAILQGKASAATIVAVGKNSDTFKAFLFPAMIEFYALLGMIVSIIMFGYFPVKSIPDIILPAKEVVENGANALAMLIG